MGSIAAPDETTLKEESHALQCVAAGTYNALSTPVLTAASEHGSGIDVHGIHIISLAARLRTASRSNTFWWPFEKFKWHAAETESPIIPFPRLTKRLLLHLSMAHSTIEAHNLLCRLDRPGAILRSFHTTCKRAATTLPC